MLKKKMGSFQNQNNVSHIDELVKCISHCGVSFRIWETRNAAGKGTGIHQFDG